MRTTGSASAISTSKPGTEHQQLMLVLSQIPPGRLCSYGDLAKLAGLPGRARWVGRQLSRLPENTAQPWHRVVNARGQISFPAGSAAYRHQLARLIDEGSASANGKIHWRQRRWPGSP